MDTKKCKTCNRIKSKSSFHVYIKNKCGYRHTCIECNRDYNKKYYHENIDYYKKYKNDNKERIKNYTKNRSEESLIKIKEYRAIRYINNRDEALKYQREYNKQRYSHKSKCPLYRIKNNVSRSIRYALKKGGHVKSKRTRDIIGIDIILFKEYIESKFETWMSWDNYGKYNGELNYGWDIDHIIPISSAKSESDILLLNHHENLRPLCSYKNRVLKRDKVHYKN